MPKRITQIESLCNVLMKQNIELVNMLSKGTLDQHILKKITMNACKGIQKDIESCGPEVKPSESKTSIAEE